MCVGGGGGGAAFYNVYKCIKHQLRKRNVSFDTSKNVGSQYTFF